MKKITFGKLIIYLFISCFLTLAIVNSFRASLIDKTIKFSASADYWNLFKSNFVDSVKLEKTYLNESLNPFSIFLESKGTYIGVY